MRYDGLPEDVELPQVEAAIDKALELDESLGEAYAISGLIQDDPAAAEVAFKRALELNPNYATAHHWYSFLLSDLSGGEELAEISKARELDPLSPVINFQVGRALGAVQDGHRKQSGLSERLLGYW
jgi:tetratricopeptide (TPR) repeat protein